MGGSVIPFPGRDPETPSDEDEALTLAAKELAAQIAAEPVPERLVFLAAELARALEAKQQDSSAEESDPDATCD